MRSRLGSEDLGGGRSDRIRSSDVAGPDRPHTLGVVSEAIDQRWHRLARIEATAWSPDRYVSATVGPSGELRRLWLDPRIYRLADADRLAATILDTVRAAAAQAHRRAFEAVAPLLGRRASSSPGDADLAFDPILEHLDRGRAASAWT